jgi:hypothetical protein
MPSQVLQIFKCSALSVVYNRCVSFSQLVAGKLQAKANINVFAVHEVAFVKAA